MKVEYFTCDVVGCTAQAEIMDKIVLPGTKGTFLRHVCKVHLQELWEKFGCVVS